MKRSLAPDGRLLVLISGPTASGKTTAAKNLAQIARRRGHKAASVDMDELIQMVAGDDWSRIEHKDRVLATKLASAVVGRLLHLEMELIAVAGSTLANREWEDLLAPLRAKPKSFYVLLRVSPEEATRRAERDPHRPATKDPALIARLASGIDWSIIRNQHVDLFTDGLEADEVARILARQIFS